MALNAAGMTLAGNGLAAGITHLSLHSAKPNATGSNATTADRVTPNFTNNGGDLSIPDRNFTGGAPNGPVTHVGFWDDDTFCGDAPITAGSDTTFNAAGEYTLKAGVILDGSATDA